MKLLLVIFVAAISISSGYGERPCHVGFRRRTDEFGASYCEKMKKASLVCPVEKGTKDGDRCVIISKHCPLGHNLLEDHQTCAKKDEKRHGKYGCDFGFAYNEEEGLCKKFLFNHTPYETCLNYFEESGNRCIGRPRKPFEVCSLENPSLPKGCVPRRSDNFFDGMCEPGFQVDPEDPISCVYNPSFPSTWCPFHYKFNPQTNMCEGVLTDKFTTCMMGDYKNGRCEGYHRQEPKWICSSPESANRTEGKFKLPTEPIVVCFEGLRNGDGCKITNSVQPIMGCPEGLSIDETGKFCYDGSIETFDNV